MDDILFHEFLTALPYRIASERSALLTSDLPGFLSVLGYSEDSVFFDFMIDLRTQVVADAIVAEDRLAEPWLAMKIMTARAMLDDPRSIWERAVRAYEPFMPERAARLVLFSPLWLGLAHGSASRLYQLVELTRQDAKDIYRALQAPDRFAAPAVAVCEDIDTTGDLALESFDYD